MAEIHRFSSRRQRLDHAFLASRLKGAKSYKRIAGYFRSSIFELVGEEIADIPYVQIVCNSELDAADVVVSKHVRETALKERWNEAPAEVEALLHKDRYRRWLPTLTDYVLVAQDRPLIDHYQRTPTGSPAPVPPHGGRSQEQTRWELETLEGRDAHLHLQSINCTVPLADVYERIVFPQVEGDPTP